MIQDRTNSVLIVVAHPDDEVLGCGGTAYSLAQRGINVRACFLSGAVEVRAQRPSDVELQEDIKKAQEILGMLPPIMGSFPNIELNTVPHLKLVQFIEHAIETTQANIIFTHHPGDLNNDHLQVSLATQAAARLFQRRSGMKRLQALYFMEILSATDWGFPPIKNFKPNSYAVIGKQGLQKKIAALQAYRRVMRPFPHSRSEEVLTSLATIRAAEAGAELCEAFECAFNLILGED